VTLFSSEEREREKSNIDIGKKFRLLGCHLTSFQKNLTGIDKREYFL
jgi:hypothetical protein